MPKMDDKQLLAIIGQYEKSALGSNVASGPTVGGNIQPANQSMTTLEIDRYNALNAYMARPLGNEVEGRSQIVLPELRDTIEWIMPQLMRMFAATQKVCAFDPENEGDEDQAEIESHVANFVFMKQNPGFFVLHDMFKDALLLRNGYVKVYWCEEDHTAVERYSGLTEIELADILNTDDDIEILEQEEKETIQQTPQGMIPGEPSFDIKLRRTTKKGYVKVECTPPEEVLISPEARRGLDECPFVEHKRELPRSDIVEMGYPREEVDAITISKPDWLNLVSLARDEAVDQLAEDEPGDPSMEEVTFRTADLRVDFDGDGIAELRRVIIGGDKILENYEIEEMSLVGCSPLRMPHRHVGISYYDLLNDLQVMKTVLTRQGFDNLYLANNQRTAINQNTVNVQDLLVSRPGGIVRVNGAPGENILPLPTNSNLMQQVIPALEYIDSLREMRTGIGKDTMGVDADALQDVTKGGQLAAMSAAALKVEMVARLLAEGVKDVFRKIHSELRRHQDKKLTVQLTGRWIDVNPAEWRERTAVSVNVGLGSGNREEARANLMLLAQAQEAMKGFNLVGPKEAYETFKLMANLLGYENPQLFAMDPDSPEYQQYMHAHPPQIPPNVQVAQIKAQTERMKDESQMARENMKLRKEVIDTAVQEQTQKLKSATEIQKAREQLAQQAISEGAQLDNQTAVQVLKMIGDIVAAQVKQDPSADAGQMVTHDYDEVKGEL